MGGIVRGKCPTQNGRGNCLGGIVLHPYIIPILSQKLSVAPLYMLRSGHHLALSSKAHRPAISLCYGIASQCCRLQKQPNGETGFLTTNVWLSVVYRHCVTAKIINVELLLLLYSGLGLERKSRPTNSGVVVNYTSFFKTMIKPSYQQTSF